MFVQEPDFEWRKSGHGTNKMGLNSKIHLAVDAFGMPVDLTVTRGTMADSSQADKLISDIEAQYLLADRGYDTNYVLDIAHSKKMQAVIPPTRNHKHKREYDQEIDEKCYQVENTSLKLKRWRGIATRYAKNTSSYTASLQICCMYLWLHIL